MSNIKFPMSNQTQNQNDKKVYDLVERTSKFGIMSINFAKSLSENNINNSIINQFIRSATSIGANYMEADCAESKKDFNHKIGICKKESKETTHWLIMIQAANPEKETECQRLFKEAHELTLIFSSIFNKK
jgi:four helix bundle protein